MTNINTTPPPVDGQIKGTWRYIKTWQQRTHDDKWQSETTEYMQSEIGELRAENDRLSALADKWNSECDEMREDNKRLDAECAKLRKLLDDCKYAIEYAADMTKPEGLSGCGCPICTVIPQLRAALGEK